MILNWNGAHYLQQFLPPLLRTTFPGRRLIVADNASSDNSEEVVRNGFPEVEWIALPKNHGFAGGYNEALKRVTADYYILLNSDVEVEPGWLEPLVAQLELHPQHAAAQPKIRAWRRKDLFEYAGAGGGWLDAYGYPFARGRVFDYCEADEGQYDTTEEVFWASGAALAIRSRVFHEMGGFDPYFFAHQEEIDLCWRIRRAGYKIFCCPQSRVYHVGGGTLPRGNSRKTYLNFRNNQIMLAKNLPLSEKWWKIPFRLALDQLSALKGLLSGDAGYFRAIIRAHTAYLYWLLTGPRPKRGGRRRLTSFPGVYGGNIVWAHFVRGLRTFASIVQRKER